MINPKVDLAAAVASGIPRGVRGQMSQGARREGWQNCPAPTFGCEMPEPLKLCSGGHPPPLPNTASPALRMPPGRSRAWRYALCTISPEMLIPTDRKSHSANGARFTNNREEGFLGLLSFFLMELSEAEETQPLSMMQFDRAPISKGGSHNKLFPHHYKNHRSYTCTLCFLFFLIALNRKKNVFRIFCGSLHLL